METRKTGQKAGRAAFIVWRPVATLRKFDVDGNLIETVRVVGNALTFSGRARFVQRLIDNDATILDASHVRLGVGNNSDVADASDTNLGDTEYYLPLDETYPSEENGILTFVATFENDIANFSWQSWGFDVDDAGSVAEGSAPVDLFNRQAFNFGDKTGGAWQLSVTLSAFSPEEEE